MTKNKFKEIPKKAELCPKCYWELKKVYFGLTCINPNCEGYVEKFKTPNIK